VELDGKHHAEQVQLDSARTEKIAAAGYLELRFTNEGVRSRLDWVLEEIRRALDAARNEPMRPSLFRMDR
jgi:very-short-patch-repair endonuclease